jgi:cyclic pyranopterin phosphate synthase
MLKDTYGRTIDYLRISVIDRCNLRCVYCTPEYGIDLLPHEEILSYEEMLDFVTAAAGLGIKHIRLTGGEPLIRKDFIGFVERLVKIPGVEDVSLTTNAVLLERYAEDLYRAGIRRVNIGIDTFDPAKFKQITRIGDVTAALAGIKKAIEVGMNPIKLNVVAMKELSDDFAPFIKMTYDYPVYVRFIEYMPVSNGVTSSSFLTAEEITAKLKTYGEMEEAQQPAGAGPGRTYYKYQGAKGAVSQISAMTKHFCPECNRLRLTADGKLRLCLFCDEEIDIKPGLRPRFDRMKTEELIRQAVKGKPERYDLSGRPKDGRTMGQIGG